MPSSTKKQANYMRAVASGLRSGTKSGPSRKVAKEFVRADKRSASNQGGAAVGGGS